MHFARILLVHRATDSRAAQGGVSLVDWTIYGAEELPILARHLQTGREQVAGQ